MAWIFAIVPIAFLLFGGWLFLTQIIPQIQRAVGQ